MDEKNKTQSAEQPRVKGHDSFLLIGVAVYLIGFFFLSLVGNNYTGVMSFLAPASILSGVLIIVIGLLF